MNLTDEEVHKLIEAISRIATNLKYLGNGDAATPMGAVEAHGVCVKEAGEGISQSLSSVSEEMRFSFLSDAYHDGTGNPACITDGVFVLAKAVESVAASIRTLAEAVREKE